jgi:hypothetical protein
MNNNKISLDSKTTFGRISKYSNKYRYWDYQNII